MAAAPPSYTVYSYYYSAILHPAHAASQPLQVFRSSCLSTTWSRRARRSSPRAGCCTRTLQRWSSKNMRTEGAVAAFESIPAFDGAQLPILSVGAPHPSGGVALKGEGRVGGRAREQIRQLVNEATSVLRYKPHR